MYILLMTRGRGHKEDYRWLTDGLVDEWWRPLHELKWLNPNSPSLAVANEGKTWRAFLAGIPSSRRDWLSGAIQFNLSAKGAHTTGQQDGYDAVTALVNLWLEDIGSGHWTGATLVVGSSRLGRILDEVFPESLVEGWFTAKLRLEPTSGTAGDPLSEWEVRAQSLVRELPARTALAHPRPEGCSRGSRFVGQITRAADRIAFAETVSSMFAGSVPGVAVYCNGQPPLPDQTEVLGLPLRAVLNDPPLAAATMRGRRGRTTGHPATTRSVRPDVRRNTTFHDAVRPSVNDTSAVRGTEPEPDDTAASAARTTHIEAEADQRSADSTVVLTDAGDDSPPVAEEHLPPAVPPDDSAASDEPASDTLPERSLESVSRLERAARFAFAAGLFAIVAAAGALIAAAYALSRVSG